MEERWGSYAKKRERGSTHTDIVEGKKIIINGLSPPKTAELLFETEVFSNNRCKQSKMNLNTSNAAHQQQHKIQSLRTYDAATLLRGSKSTSVQFLDGRLPGNDMDFDFSFTMEERQEYKCF